MMRGAIVKKLALMALPFSVLVAVPVYTGAQAGLVQEQAVVRRPIPEENSFILVLLYPVDSAHESHRKIEQIRRLYITQFQQESVLRVDDPHGVWVSF